MKTDHHLPPPDTAPASVLAVALRDEALEQLPRHVLAPASDVTLCALAQVTPCDVTGPKAPDLVLAPLTARGFDGVDLLSTLNDAGYAGRVLLLAPPLPDIPLVRADVSAQAPRLNVDVIALDGRSALHLI